MFLDCIVECSHDYYRQALNYFDWVRDRHEADFALSLVARMASNGAYAYTVTLRFPRDPARPDLARVVNTQPGDQTATIRALLLDAMLRCLHDAVHGTPHERAFTLSLPRRSKEDLESVVDGWDHWVFSPEIMAEFAAESRSGFLKLDGTLNIRRITEASKFRSTTGYQRRTTSYVLEDDERVTGHANAMWQRFVYAHSLGKQWALGAIAAAERNEPDNYQLQLHGGPVLEYNVFPYEENATRQLRFAYQVGAWYTDYFERTTRNKLVDAKPYHALSAILDLNQAWGSVQLILQGNTFIDQPKYWRVASGVVLSVSLVAGLALTFTGEAAWIEDQIGLRGRPLLDREVFLETTELQTNWSVTGEFGFSYTFGSVHNTIVNPRFGRIDFEEE